jgi:hypothetical protein
MASVLQGKTFGFTSGSIAPDHYWNGIPIAADGDLAIENGGDIDHFSQGLPMTAVGRLVVAIDGVVDHYGSGAAPFDVNNRLCVNVAGGAIVANLAAVGYVATGQVALLP